MRKNQKSSALTPQRLQAIREMLSKSGELPPERVEEIMRHIQAPKQTLLSRIQMLAEQIPQEIVDKYMVTPQERDIFLTVADPDRWPKTMRPLRKWIEQNVPPGYWAADE